MFGIYHLWQLCLRKLLLPAYRIFMKIGIYLVAASVVAMICVQVRWYLVDSDSYFILNQPASREYRAIRDTSYEDLEMTEEIREKVRESIEGVLVSGHMKSQVGFNEECDILLNSPLEDTILPHELRALLDVTPLDKREEIISTVRDINDSLILEQAMTSEEKVEFIWKKIPTAESDPASANMIFQIITGLREGDNKIDGVLTERTKTLVADDIKTIKRILYAGDVVVEKGEIVTPQYADILQAQGYPQGKYPYSLLVFSVIVACISVAWTRATISSAFANIAFHVDWTYPFFLLIASWLFQIAVVYLGITGLGVFPIIAIIYLTFPSSGALNCALTVTISSSIIAYGHDVASFMVSIISGCAGVMISLPLFKKNFSRTAVWVHIFVLGMFMDLVAVAVKFGMSSFIDNRDVSILVATTAMLSFMVIALLPLLEILFDVISPLQLVELTQPSNPLLKRLQVEAPGTYHHSQMVGNLAEAGAEAVGLNPMLLRAGAFYHDIGKLRRPQFFIENQMGENDHDAMDPMMSAMIILSHVKDGLSIAREYRLPTQITTFIREHHGTTCLVYFYKKALQSGLKVNQSQFCYPGPKPQSRESCVLMLADSTEAAARSQTQKLKEVHLSQLVDGVIQSKIASGQLDLVRFTMKDIFNIKLALIKTLRSMYHTRNITPLRSEKRKGK